MLVYDNVLKGLEPFAGERIQFDAVTVSWLKRYADFLGKRGEGANNHIDTPATCGRC